MLQRFVDRYQLWHEDRRRETEDKNPLNLSWRAAVGTVLLVAFLVLYIRRSRWAWVVIPTFGAIMIMESPLAYFAAPERYSAFVRAISMCLFVLFGAAIIAYGFVVRNRYGSYLEKERRYRAADTPNV